MFTQYISTAIPERQPPLDVLPCTDQITSVQNAYTPRPDIFESRLRDHGHAWTAPRRAISHFLCGSTAHPTAAEVLAAVAGDQASSSRATVYNTLTLLEDLGLIRTVLMTPGETRYDANVTRHHHLVCTHCGCVEDVPAEDVSVALRGKAALAEVRFEGLCVRCTNTP
jgi:Fur family peroxide stress response transcriptional regulator